MKILLDTHIFLWYISGDPKLPDAHLNAIRDPSNAIYFSSASIWEAVIKNQIGKLPLPKLPAAYLPQQRDLHGITPLAIDDGAFEKLSDLPLLHRDPFDRMLVAQTFQYGLTISTVDPLVMMYNVQVLGRN